MKFYEAFVNELGKLANGTQARVRGSEGGRVRVSGHDLATLQSGGYMAKTPGGVDYAAPGKAPKRIKDPTKPDPASPFNAIIDKHIAANR